MNIRSMTKFLCFVGTLSLLIPLLLSCAPAAEPTPTPAPPTPTAAPAAPTPKPVAKPKAGGTLHHVCPSGITPNFDPHLSISYKIQLVSSFVHSNLLKFVYGAEYDPSDFTLKPDLAEKWEMSKDGLTFTFHLYKGVKWQNKPPLNGRELVAADVKWSLERFLDKSGYKANLGKVKTIEAPDNYTLKITLEEPYAPFLHWLSLSWLGTVAKEVVEQFGDLKGPDAHMGSGPFMLEKYEPGVKVTFVKNPDYFVEGLPYLDKVEWMNVPEKATQLSMLRAGKLEMPYYDARIGRADVDSVKKSNPDYNMLHWPWLAIRTLAFRLDKTDKPWNDVRVRQAMSMCIDRETVVKTILMGYGWTDPGPVPAPMTEWKLPTKDLGQTWWRGTGEDFGIFFEERRWDTSKYIGKRKAAY